MHIVPRCDISLPTLFSFRFRSNLKKNKVFADNVGHRPHLSNFKKKTKEQRFGRRPNPKRCTSLHFGSSILWLTRQSLIFFVYYVCYAPVSLTLPLPLSCLLVLSSRFLPRPIDSLSLLLRKSNFGRSTKIIRTLDCIPISGASL